MSAINVSNLVSSLQQLSSLAQPQAEAGITAGTTPGGNFGDLLKQSIRQVSASQEQAGDLAARFERGDTTVDLGQTMVAIQKADLSLRAMTEVRNKVVDAYKDIMNMPV